MKPKTYKIEFYTGIPGVGPFVYVTAFGVEQARILAQAERIKAGQCYLVENVWDDDRK